MINFKFIRKVYKYKKRKFDFGFSFEKAGYFTKYPLLRITISQLIALFLFMGLVFF